MKSWEFLLQKEGDRTWLPLENSTVEILEGRYRVVARTPCAKEEVDIYVSFVSSEDDPPKRRIQQRSHAANDDGLLAILPFTPFRPGRWELRCRPHVEAGDTAQQWHSQIELQVLPQDNQVDDDDLFGWDRPQDDAPVSRVTTIDPPETATEPAAAVTEALSATELDPATASDEDIERLAAEMSQMVAGSSGPAAVEPAAAVEQAMAVEQEDITGEPTAPIEAPESEPEAPNSGFAAMVDGAEEPGALAEPLAADGAAETNEKVVEQPGLEIALEEDVLMMQGDRRVTVRGQILSSTAAPSASPADAILPAELLLIVELRDPSTTEIWASYRENFSQAVAPVTFTTELQLPVACRTQLFLGNATLWQVEDNGNLERLVSQDFNAMAAVDDLLEQARQSEPVVSNGLEAGAVSNLQQQAASNFLVTKFGAQPKASQGTVQINTELLNLLKPTSRTAGAQDSSASAPRRPTVDQPVAQPASKPRLELPSFGNATPVALPLADSLADDLAQDIETHPGDRLANSDDFAGATLEAEALPLAEDARAFQPTDLADELGEENPFALPGNGELDDLALLSAMDGAIRDGVGDAIATPPLTDALGQASALEPETVDSETSASETLLPEANAGTELALDASDQPSLLAGDLGLASELSLGSESAMVGTQNAELLSSQAGLAHEVVVDDEETLPPAKLAWMQPSADEGKIDEDIAVPVPELTVPDGTLVKGKTVRIQVRVAQEPARLCARVWLLDCQSRTLLGEPQWITAFLPLGDDWMEANVDLVIPEGSIELQVEAIAVEPITQRESRKISTRRGVSLGSDNADIDSW